MDNMSFYYVLIFNGMFKNYIFLGMIFICLNCQDGSTIGSESFHSPRFDNFNRERDR